MRRALVAASGAVILSSLFLGPASADTVYPSQGQVEAAKNAVSVAAGSLAEIEAAYAGAALRLTQVQAEAGLAQAAADSARSLLAERTSRADQARVDAASATAEKARADRAVRQTAAQIYQEQGSMGGVGAYLGAGGPQELADRTAAMSVIGDLRQQALENAAAAANRQTEAQRVAATARTQQQAASVAADAASADAQARSRAAADEASRIGAEQQQRIAALAAARQTSAEVERARQDGLAAEAAAREAARKAAEQAAVEARLQAEAQARAKAEGEAAAREEAARAAAQAAADAAARAAAKAAADAAAAAKKPAPRPAPPSSGSSGTSSPGTSSAGGTTTYRQAHLGVNANAIYSAIRTTFGITDIGGYRAGDTGDHGAGNAVDVMTSSFAEGDAVAAWAQAHSSQFGVKYVIWKQRIWFPGNGPDQWRWMADRGSITQNHYDHVHISVY